MSIWNAVYQRLSQRSLSCAALLAGGLLLADGQALARTDVCYKGGFNLPNFKLNGQATLTQQSVVVTQDLGSQLGSAMYLPSFASTSDLHIEMKLQITTAGAMGADGMAFVMHRDPRGASALGDPGGGIGYGGVAKITPSVIVEMDTFTNTNDANNNHVGVMYDGNENNHVASFTPPFSMAKSGQPFYLWVDYTAAANQLLVFVSDTAVKPASANLTVAVDLGMKFGGQPFLMGFSGSTGGLQSKHEVLSLIASDSVLTNGVCCANNAECAGSPLGSVCDPVKLVCGQCTPTDLSGCAAAKKSCDIGPPSNACIAPCDGAFGTNTPSACPSASAPSCIPSGPDKGSCVACNGNAGSAATQACPAQIPSCNVTGFCGLCGSNDDCAATCDTTAKLCVSCNGDAGSSATQACPATKGAFCDPLGGCRSCISDAECKIGTHPGPFCNLNKGNCSANCFQDSHCASGSGMWCLTVDDNGGSCQPKVVSGAPLPSGVTCSPAVAMRACESGLCGANNTCVQCVADADCGSSTTAMVCDQNLCKPKSDLPTDGRQRGLAGGGFGCSTAPTTANSASLLTALSALAAFSLLRISRRRRTAA